MTTPLHLLSVEGPDTCARAGGVAMPIAARSGDQDPP